ncbi:MAG: M48 family peptidase, partial [Candidatus Thiodiazotropha taylori]|nr:M48 family peptidase [Candidatus Thiodiazotropha taylori]MCW4256989.1 M48 family peptidase [Candidatus Thiodiazotropha taylori]
MKVCNRFTLILILFTLVACATSPTGRKQLMIVSEEMAINSSKTAYTEMLKPYQEEGKLDNDPLLKARVARITGRLIAQAVK